MVVALSVLAGAALLAAVCLAVKYAVVARALGKIGDRLEYVLREDTNIGIDLFSYDRRVKKLTRRLNAGVGELRRLKAAVLRDDRALKEAAANISHDLRTPLTSVTGYVSLLDKCELTGDARRYLTVIKGRVQAMKQLTDELFGYAVAATESPAPQPERVALGDLLADALTEFYVELTRRGIEPVVDLCEEEVARTLDRSAAARVIENVLSNAVKYSLGDLTVRLCPDGTMTFSNRADLDKVTVGRLFDRFFTVDSARSSTGLGLTIARVLTERLGGDISADYDGELLTVTLKL